MPRLMFITATEVVLNKAVYPKGVICFVGRLPKDRTSITKNLKEYNVYHGWKKPALEDVRSGLPLILVTDNPSQPGLASVVSRFHPTIYSSFVELYKDLNSQSFRYFIIPTKFDSKTELGCTYAYIPDLPINVDGDMVGTVDEYITAVKNNIPYSPDMSGLKKFRTYSEMLSEVRKYTKPGLGKPVLTESELKSAVNGFDGLPFAIYLPLPQEQPTPVPEDAQPETRNVREDTPSPEMHTYLIYLTTEHGSRKTVKVDAEDEDSAERIIREDYDPGTGDEDPENYFSIDKVILIK